MDLLRFRRRAPHSAPPAPTGDWLATRSVTVAETDLNDALLVLDDVIALVELSAGVDDAQGQWAALQAPTLRDIRERLRPPAHDDPSMDYGRGEWRSALARALGGRDLSGLNRRQARAAHRTPGT